MVSSSVRGRIVEWESERGKEGKGEKGVVGGQLIEIFDQSLPSNLWTCPCGVEQRSSCSSLSVFRGRRFEYVWELVSERFRRVWVKVFAGEGSERAFPFELSSCRDDAISFDLSKHRAVVHQIIKCLHASSISLLKR